ncbi:coagulation factor IX-like isoform X2 [Hermetia illucens]|uniref:coagulation factor IX-like isoform X2 n=1 Tax=Hermetia illucens TaxID=343691 RepID=UPI0018CC6992|nr:coagulation factor IX-like isoform X2 [Hermetia illucens]
MALRLLLVNSLSWHVALIERSAENCKVNCAGTLITELNILTAAKCFRKPGAVANNFAFAGDIDVGEVVDIPPSRQVRTIVRATTHPSAFRNLPKTNSAFDVAVLEVIAPFKLTQYANLAAVAPNDLPNLSYCMGLGFGKIGDNAPSGKLHYGRLRIDRSICKCPCCYCIYSTEVEMPANDLGSPLLSHLDEHQSPRYIYGLLSSGYTDKSGMLYYEYPRLSNLNKWINMQLNKSHEVPMSSASVLKLGGIHLMGIYILDQIA